MPDATERKFDDQLPFRLDAKKKAALVRIAEKTGGVSAQSLLREAVDALIRYADKNDGRVPRDFEICHILPGADARVPIVAEHLTPFIQAMIQANLEQAGLIRPATPQGLPKSPKKSPRSHGNE
jgi:hypothetical protein